MDEVPRYTRGVDEVPAGTYSQNEDGTYSPAVPLEVIDPGPWTWRTYAFAIVGGLVGGGIGNLIARWLG